MRSPPARSTRSTTQFAAVPARALCLAVAALASLGAGCASTTTAGSPRFACYDARGRVELTIITQSECEVRNWFWRERP